MTIKQTLTVQLMQANLRIAELEAQLAVAQSISELHHALRPAPVVTRYTKLDGSVWEKTRVGNRAVSRQVLSN